MAQSHRNGPTLGMVEELNFPQGDPFLVNLQAVHSKRKNGGQRIGLGVERRVILTVPDFFEVRK